MIEKKKIGNILNELVAGKDYFVVEIRVNEQNKITVLMDRYGGMTLDDCVWFSRAIEARLDRKVEDFELEVSSPGLNAPFKVHEQYVKNMGKEVEVLKKDGIKVRGKLMEAGDQYLLIGETGHRPKRIELDDIKHTKEVIRF